MKYAYKVIFAMLSLILFLNPSFGNKIINMSYNPITHYLTISHDVSYGGTTDVTPGEHISWNIIDGRIKSFVIIAKHGGDIFTVPIPAQPGVSLDLIVKPQPAGDWYYSIKIWISPTVWYTYDPKIAIKPSRSPMTGLLIGLASAFFVTTITTVVFYRRWKKAEMMLAQNNDVQK